MKNEKLRQEPAFPCVDTIHPETNERCLPIETGISKRFYAACAAMQGILANSSIIEKIGSSKLNNNQIRQMITGDAYAIADELLKQENE